MSNDNKELNNVENSDEKKELTQAELEQVTGGKQYDTRFTPLT